MSKDEKNLFIMVSVYDKVSERFGLPVTTDNEGTAIRSFILMTHNKETMIGQSYDDFVLYRIGYFDPLTGEIFAKFKKDSDVLITGTEAYARGEQ